MIPPVRKTVALADGAQSLLEWRGDGQDGGLLHFAHANGFNAQTYQSLLQPLSGRFHILAGDARGHGASRLPTPEGFAKDWMVFRDDLIALLQAQADRPALLVGHSMGGVASLMVAAVRPDLVRGLVLIEPVFIPALAPLLRRLTRRPGRTPGWDMAMRAVKRRDVFPSHEAIVQSYRGRGAFKRWPDEMLTDYIAGGTRPTEDGQIRLACAPVVEAADFRATPVAAYRLARDLQCPVTLIHGGAADTSCGAREVRKFVSGKPDTRVVPIKKAGHFLPMERPDIVRDEINRIADRI